MKKTADQLLDAIVVNAAKNPKGFRQPATGKKSKGRKKKETSIDRLAKKVFG